LSNTVYNHSADITQPKDV